MLMGMLQSGENIVTLCKCTRSLIPLYFANGFGHARFWFFQMTTAVGIMKLKYKMNEPQGTLNKILIAIFLILASLAMIFFIVRKTAYEIKDLCNKLLL